MNFLIMQSKGKMMCKSLVKFFMHLLPFHNTLKLQRQLWIAYNNWRNGKLEGNKAGVQGGCHSDAILSSKHMYLSILLRAPVHSAVGYFSPLLSSNSDLRKTLSMLNMLQVFLPVLLTIPSTNTGYQVALLG